MSFDEALSGVIALHERGHLTMVMRGEDGAMSLQPCFKDGELVGDG
jgi:hypothetical protein